MVIGFLLRLKIEDSTTVLSWFFLNACVPESEITRPEIEINNPETTIHMGVISNSR